jgi:DNA polymerase-1
MQGTAADIIKKAMLLVDEWTKASASDVTMIMQVHDELVFELPSATLERAQQAIRERMESAATLSVPLVVDIGVGENWDKAH